ncbi:MAG: trypsin-like peptidase domain-containing protein [Clostridia bacterium]|nr:trypsin-like peptidase domain-containing protein [Clostridia bacterium]
MAQENEPSQWSGTGFALDEGYIVTNNHVVEGATTIKIYGVRGDMERCYRAKVVGTDKINDLALLKMESYISTNTDVLPYSVKFSMAEVGEDIFVLGYPLTQLLGNEIKLTNGIISSRTGYDGDVNNYQISAPVQPGNSGGPVFDKDGNVVGIVVSGMDKKLATNVNYAIKTSCLANLVESVADKTIFPTGRNLRGLSLAEQTKKVKDFIYYIHCSSE